MDTSFWNSLNYGIKFKETKKRFWGQYLWRMEIHADCAQVACYDNTERAVELLKLQAQNRSNWGGSWRHKAQADRYDKVDFGLLKSIRTLKENFVSLTKTRIEDSNVQFYTKDENDLKSVAKILSTYSCIRAITGPRAGTEELLCSDVIIAPKIPFKYKILLRDGTYDLLLKEQMLNLLESQEDVKLTAGLRHNLKRPYPGMWGAFFYTNDLGVVTMLSLMSPGIVGKIHEVVQA